MDIGQTLDNIIEKAKEATINYIPNPANLEKNKNRAILGAAALGGAYILPGDHPILVSAALIYTAIKSYHLIRDWAR